MTKEFHRLFYITSS